MKIGPKELALRAMREVREERPKVTLSKPVAVKVKLKRGRKKREGPAPWETAGVPRRTWFWRKKHGRS